MKELFKLIIEEIYGSQFNALISVLLQEENLDIYALIKKTKLEFQILKEQLLILIKNNIISFKTTIEEDVDLSEDVSYSLNYGEVLNILRYPSFIETIKRYYSSDISTTTMATTILEIFLLENILSCSEVLSQSLEILAEKREENPKIHYSEEDILRVLIGLIQSNHLVQVGGIKPNLNFEENLYETIPEETAVGNSLKRKSKGKMKKPEKKIKLNANQIKIFDFDELPKHLKDLTESNHLKGNSDEMKIEGKKEKIDKNHHLLVKTKVEKLKFTYFKYDNLSKREFLYKVNSRQFIHDLRTNVIVECVQEKITFQSGTIIHAMLKNSRIISKAFEIKNTENISIEDILKLLPSNLKVDQTSLTSHLEILKNDNGHFIRETSFYENGMNVKKYSVDLQMIIKNLQIKSYEQILEKNYSANFVRIFRIICRFPHSDERKIREIAMLPLNETRNIISEMMKTNIAQYDDVIDEKGVKITLYNIRMRNVFIELISTFYKTLLNLKVQKFMLEETLNNVPIINPEKKEEILTKIKKVESAILDVDSILILFTEF